MFNATTPPFFFSLFISCLEDLFLKISQFLLFSCSLLLPDGPLFFPPPWCGAAGPWSKYGGSERVCPHVHCCHHACLSLCMPHVASSPPFCLLLSKSLSPWAFPMAHGRAMFFCYMVTHRVFKTGLDTKDELLNNLCVTPLIFLAPFFSNPRKSWWWWEGTYQKPLVT